MTNTLKLQSKPRSYKAREALMNAVAGMTPFTTSGSLSGETCEHGAYEAGRLAGADLDRFRAERDDIDYVVRSYATPIAWHTPGGWHIVAQTFSVTTAAQQGIVRQALSY